MSFFGLIILTLAVVFITLIKGKHLKAVFSVIGFFAKIVVICLQALIIIGILSFTLNSRQAYKALGATPASLIGGKAIKGYYEGKETKVGKNSRLGSKQRNPKSERFLKRGIKENRRKSPSVGRIQKQTDSNNNRSTKTRESSDVRRDKAKI